MQNGVAHLVTDYTTKDIVRFWDKVAITANPDLCWVWVAYCDKVGYGRFGHHSNTLSHRIAWEISNGKSAGKLKVLHSCDNPSCCNPKHLFLGTQADNVADMMQKGRAATTEQRSIPKRGELNPSHKLSNEQVSHIRKRYAEGGITQKQIAIEMCISRTAVVLIIGHKRWRD